MTAAGAQAADPWLAVIDMQRVFADPASGWFTPRIAETVGPIKELVAAFGGCRSNQEESGGYG
jgi:nicotinamidase-related amidase